MIYKIITLISVPYHEEIRIHKSEMKKLVKDGISTKLSRPPVLFCELSMNVAKKKNGSIRISKEGQPTELQSVLPAI